ncbi:portal protein, partial [Xanthomonas vasicola pv. vasculorum NCPPB 895]
MSYSSLSLDYNGTYSAQRQELVEKWGSYLMLAERFIALFVRPTRQRFIEAAVLSGKVRMPRGWTLRHLAASTYVRPIMPWIDPLKEAYAKGEAEDRGWVSPQQNTL